MGFFNGRLGEFKFLKILYHVFIALWNSLNYAATVSTSPMQWRRHDFFEGESLGHLKPITRPPQGVRGQRPPDDSEVSIFKTIQSIRQWIHFSKIATFFLPRKSIFSTKTFEKWNRLYKNFLFFRKIILKFSIFMIHYKSREMSGEFYYLVEKLIKKAQKIA